MKEEPRSRPEKTTPAAARNDETTGKQNESLPDPDERTSQEMPVDLPEAKVGVKTKFVVKGLDDSSYAISGRLLNSGSAVARDIAVKAIFYVHSDGDEAELVEIDGQVKPRDLDPEEEAQYRVVYRGPEYQRIVRSRLVIDWAGRVADGSRGEEVGR